MLLMVVEVGRHKYNAFFLISGLLYHTFGGWKGEVERIATYSLAYGSGECLENSFDFVVFVSPFRPDEEIYLGVVA